MSVFVSGAKCMAYFLSACTCEQWYPSKSPVWCTWYQCTHTHTHSFHIFLFRTTTTPPRLKFFRVLNTFVPLSRLEFAFGVSETHLAHFVRLCQNLQLGVCSPFNFKQRKMFIQNHDAMRRRSIWWCWSARREIFNFQFFFLEAKEKIARLRQINGKVQWEAQLNCADVTK